MGLLIFIPLAIIVISSVFTYLYMRALKTPDKSVTKTVDQILADAQDPKKSKSRDMKPKSKAAAKPSVKPSVVETPQPVAIIKKPVQPEPKPTPPKPKKKPSEPAVTSKPVSTPYFDDSDETPATEWIPVETGKKKQKSQKRNSQPEISTTPSPLPSKHVTPAEPTKPKLIETIDAPIIVKSVTPVQTAKQGGLTLNDTMRMERDALRSQVSLMQEEIEELQKRLKTSQENSKTKKLEFSPPPTNAKSDELQKKLNDALQQIELLKAQRPTTMVTSKPDPSILEALQSEITRLVRELTLAKQKNESMEARLSFAEKKLKDMEQPEGATAVPTVKATAKGAVEAKDKQIAELKAELQKNEKKQADQVKTLNERLEASDEIAKRNYQQMEAYRVELEKVKSAPAVVMSNGGGGDMDAIHAMEEEKKVLQKSLSELQARLSAVSTAKEQLENHEKREREIRELMEAEMKKLKEQLANMKSADTSEQMINGSCNLADFQSALFQLSKASPKVEELKRLLPKMEKIVSRLEPDSMASKTNSSNGHHSAANGKSSRSRIASKDQLIELCTENKHYKELLSQTEANLSALQNLVVREQSVWKKELCQAQTLNSQLEEKISKLEQQLKAAQQQK